MITVALVTILAKKSRSFTVYSNFTKNRGGDVGSDKDETKGEKRYVFYIIKNTNVKYKIIIMKA